MAFLRNKLRPFSAARVGLAGYIVLASCLSFGQTTNSCLDCHSALPDPLGVSQEKFSQDIHAQRGLTCASCHGGNPTSDDPDKAMSRKAGWKGKIDRKQIPQLCGSCHSDPAYIRQFNPSLRTDQLDQYHTSVHGKRFAAGDTKVAVCTDCHSVHDLRAPSDPRSTVNPVNVANTCARCHSDANYMKGYSISTDQFAKYSTSVHHQALAVRGDLSAPTCTTCHGEPWRGAARSRQGSECGARTVTLFKPRCTKKVRTKRPLRRSILPGCVVCHSNHGVSHPTDVMLGTGPDAVCMRCHTPGDTCDQARARLQSSLSQLDEAIKSADQVLGVAESSGMEVSEARLRQDQARDSLTKARVTIHSFRTDLVDQDIQAGLKIAAKNLQAGKQAMVERNYRRVGLGISLLAIGMVLVGLRLYIKKIES